MRSPDPLTDRDQLDLYAQTVVLRDDNEALRMQVAYLESQVEGLRAAIDLIARET